MQTRNSHAAAFLRCLNRCWRSCWARARSMGARIIASTARSFSSVRGGSGPPSSLARKCWTALRRNLSFAAVSVFRAWRGLSGHCGPLKACGGQPVRLGIIVYRITTHSIIADAFNAPANANTNNVHSGDLGRSVPAMSYVRTISSRRPSSPKGAYLWAWLRRVDISSARKLEHAFPVAPHG
jgi:hypothetical protein